MPFIMEVQEAVSTLRNTVFENSIFFQIKLQRVKM